MAKARDDKTLSNLTGEPCAWCHGALPTPIHCREGRDGSLFCSSTCERKYEADVLGIDEVYG